MKYIILLLLFISNISHSQDCANSFSAEYDKFDKELKSELDYRIILKTFETDDGQSWIGDHIGLSWRQTFINDSKSSNDKGWRNLKYDGIELNIWSKIQIEDCFEYDCWQFSDTYTKFNGYDYKDWDEYLLGNKSYLSGYSYVMFLSTNGDTKKIYIKYDDSATHLILNDAKFPKTVENYNWLIQNDIESIRFYNAKRDENLDIDVPFENRSTIKEVIECIEIYKTMIKDEYSMK